MSNSMDIPYRVESLAGDEIGEETNIIYTIQEATFEGGWLIQSQANLGVRNQTE